MTVKPQAKDLYYHLSQEAQARRPSNLKAAFEYTKVPGMISLGGGLPLPAYFPFDEITGTAPAAPFDKYNDPAAAGTAPQVTITVDRYNAQKADMIPLARALQYGQSDGCVELLDWVREHTAMVHKVPYANWDVLTTVGNTQAWDAMLRLFTARGDTILAEEYTFSSAMEAAHAQGVQIVPVKVDLEGILADKLDEQLSAWEGPKPKLLYTIPTGQNPTGGTLSPERRAAVYAVLQKHDILIVEDEPYYFLQMDPYEAHTTVAAPDMTDAGRHARFLAQLVTSYLALDVDGRVLRLDSFSKVLAPGTRLGFIVAQKPFIERLTRHNEVSIQTPAGFSQSIIYGLLAKWGQTGYLDWLLEMRKEYTQRRNTCMDALTDALHKPAPYAPNSLKHIVEWKPPMAGMFFWIKVDARQHPEWATLGAAGVEDRIHKAGIAHSVLTIPGSWFLADQHPAPRTNDDDDQSIFFRGTFASVDKTQIETGITRMAEVLAAEFKA
ncbi:pyridoxal phosphate-dependent transferase [Dipodascopsis tothii]|uniref:pyridoxal phosphate-dependent transferase n=1 Tax=Dipodascopsis tothii TaxID=44089 RepID=UPI0034CD6B23